MAINIAVLLSGGGTTLQNLIDHIEAGELDAKIACVISSRVGAYGLERAKHHGIPAMTISRKDFGGDVEEFNKAIWDALGEYDLDMIALAGFMSLLHVPAEFENRIMNTHPALVPSFCGKGMYGHHVHEAVLEYGCKTTGATIHFVDEHYDHGPIILQDCVPVLDEDTADSLAERVQEMERKLYPLAIRYFAEGRIRVEGRRVRIL